MKHFEDLNPNPVFQCDRAGTVLLANAAADKLDSEESRLTGRNVCDIFQDIGADELRFLIDNDGLRSLDAAVGGRFFTFALRGARRHQILQCYGVEITEWRDMETQFRRALSAAEAAAKAKSEFLATMSHEIRTPMNGIVGMTELLLESGLSEGQQESARIILSSADALLRIINDILDFSKIEAGKLELENIEFDLRASLEEIAELFAPKIQSKGLEFPVQIEPEVPRHIVGDPVRFRQIVSNLIGNAVKFTDSGEIRVRCSVVEHDELRPTLRVDVIDTGIGIPRDRLDSLFSSFTQADASTTRKYGGTGLGLAICKELAEAMGGLIGVHSVQGNGSVFSFGARFRLPQNQPAQKPARADDLYRLRILLCTPNESNQRSLRALYATWECETLAVTDQHQALELVRFGCDTDNAFRILVLDYDLLENDLDKFVREVREVTAAHRIGIIVLAGVHDRKRVSELKIPTDTYLTKPVRRDQLARATRAAISGASGEAVSSPTRLKTPSAFKGHPGRRILVAEDNPINQKLVNKILTDAGHEVELAENGLIALEKLARGEYDIVLMDCQMPELDGYEATQRIRNGNKSRDVPIIGLTANAMSGDREKCLAAGMTDYLTKPFKPVELREKIHELTMQPGDPS